MSKSNVVNLPEWTRVGSEDKKQRQALRTRITAWGQKQRYVQLIAAKKWMLLLSFMGFLLGRAMILDELSLLLSHTLPSLCLCVATLFYL